MFKIGCKLVPNKFFVSGMQLGYDQFKQVFTNIQIQGKKVQTFIKQTFLLITVGLYFQIWQHSYLQYLNSFLFVV